MVGTTTQELPAYVRHSHACLVPGSSWLNYVILRLGAASIFVEIAVFCDAACIGPITACIMPEFRDVS